MVVDRGTDDTPWGDGNTRRGAPAASDPAATHDSLGPRDRRTIATRRALLDTSRAVFTELGYEPAHKDEILRRAGVSNGSLYHHFGGKAELFLALHAEFGQRCAERARWAMEAMRSQGVDDHVELYLEVCRSYLDACWDDRDLATLFASGEGPAGFAAARQGLLAQWIERNARLLGLRAEEPLVHAVTAVMAEAGRLVAIAGSGLEAHRVRDEFLEIIVGMMAPLREHTGR